MVDGVVCGQCSPKSGNRPMPFISDSRDGIFRKDQTLKIQRKDGILSFTGKRNFVSLSKEISKIVIFSSLQIHINDKNNMEEVGFPLF
jgi:hypothetical protein